MEWPTETQLKLSDAAVQMKLALDKSDSEPVFRSCINSFISSARSVTMVMEKESKGIPGLHEWYKKQTKELAEQPLMKFFNNRRVHSIHKASVRINTHSAPIFNLRIKGESSGDSSDPDNTGTMIWWTFDNVKEFMPDDSGNVINLCDEYFRTMRNLVAGWLYEKVTKYPDS